MSKNKLLAVVGASMLATSVYANAAPMPLCPASSTIKSVGISGVVDFTPGYFIGVEENSYNMDRNWIFGIGLINANSVGEAIKRANIKLKGVNGPVESVEDDNAVLCFYENSDPNILGVALSGDEMMSMQKAQRIMHKYIK